MLVIGLTGSIGMGKSTIAGRLRELGVGVCDADAVVHALYRGAAVAPIEAQFPGTTRDGQVDRGMLGEALIADPSGFLRLEAIVHPLVQAAERDFLAAEAARGAEMAVLEIPLLYETGGDRGCDVVIVVSASTEVQRERVLARPGMTADRLESLLSRQVPDAEKRRRADFVVDTNGTLEESLAQVDAIIASLRGRSGTALRAHWS